MKLFHINDSTMQKFHDEEDNDQSSLGTLGSAEGCELLMNNKHLHAFEVAEFIRQDDLEKRRKKLFQEELHKQTCWKKFKDFILCIKRN